MGYARSGLFPFPIFLLLAFLELGCGDECWMKHKNVWELDAVSGCNESSVFAVGDTIIRTVGSRWFPSYGHGAVQHFTDVCCISPDDVYTVDASGEIWHFDGREWEQVAKISGESEEAHLSCVWNSSDGQLFVTGRMDDAGIVMKQESGDWVVIHQEPQESFRSIWGSASTDLYLAGRNHVLHYNGSEWSEIALDDEGPFGDLSGVSADEIYVLSKNAIWLLGDAGPSLILEFPDFRLHDLYAPRTGELYAAGGDYSSRRNKVLRYRNGKWRDIGRSIGEDVVLTGIWVGQEGRVVAAGVEQEVSGLVGALLEYTCE